MPRFVVLRHEVPADAPRGSHWDLMLEDQHDLATWALEALPHTAQRTVTATRLPAHRAVYLHYEGPVSGNRGDVRRYDAGYFDWETREPGLIRVRIVGQRLRGCLTLRPAGHDGVTWVLQWEPAGNDGPELPP